MMFYPPLKLRYPLKMDGWKTSFLLGWPIFRYYVSFRECNFITLYHGPGIGDESHHEITGFPVYLYASKYVILQGRAHTSYKWRKNG